MDLVSIIVPIYNVDKYLSECLESIINQTYSNLEIILVNDGSIDNSLTIMTKYALIDNRIKLHSQENKGVSAARNKGIVLATGKFILFVDSDDTVREDTVEILYQEIVKKRVEVVVGNAMLLYSNGISVPFLPREDVLQIYDVLSGDTCYTQLMSANAFPPLVYLYFIRRDFIEMNKLFFHEGIVHEDELWCAKVMLLANRISLTNFYYYFYRQRENSIMNSDNKVFRIHSLFFVIKEFHSFLLTDKKNISKDSVGFVYVRILFIFYRMTDLLPHSEPFFYSYIEYITDLFKQVYSDLSYKQQKSSLFFYFKAHSILHEKSYI